MAEEIFVNAENLVADLSVEFFHTELNVLRVQDTVRKDDERVMRKYAVSFFTMELPKVILFLY